MKHTMVKYILAVAVLTFGVSGASVTARAADDGSRQISGNEAKNLIRHASSPQDYQRLASYFEKQAESSEAKAHYYDKQANEYPTSTGIHPKVPYPGGWGLYCRYLASQYSLDAQKARANAERYKAAAHAGHSWVTSPGPFTGSGFVQRVAWSAASRQSAQPENADAISPGTIIPVRLGSSLNSEKTKPGQTITARVMQDIPLASEGKIRAGSELIGRITAVTNAHEGGGGAVSFLFDELSTSHSKTPVHLYLRAIASRLEVEEAQMPSAFSEEANPETSWTVLQVGGDVVYRDGGVVMRGGDVVGKPLWPSDDVIEFDGHHKAQAVWVFSLDASGAYGLSGARITHAGKASPLGAITLSSQSGPVNVAPGSGLLLVAAL